MGAGMLRMVDQVAAAARRPPLQAAQLIDQPLEVQELRPAGVEQWQRVAVDVRLRRLAQLIRRCHGGETARGPIRRRIDRQSPWRRRRP